MKEIRRKKDTNDYLPVEDFVKEGILEPEGLDCGFSWSDRIENLNWYFELSEAFHKPKGEGYKLVRNCLQKYLDFKFIRENNCFRFREKLFDQRVEIYPDYLKDSCRYAVSNGDDEAFFDGSQADIYYLLHEADQEGIATRRCINYVNSNRLHLTAVLIQLIERIVENLERNPLKKYQEYGRVLRTVYMTPEYAEYDVFSLFDVLGFTKKKYYRVRNAAISLLSQILFGVLAGEHGFAKLYINQDTIYFNQKA